jgi:hypothetical protein
MKITKQAAINTINLFTDVIDTEIPSNEKISWASHIGCPLNSLYVFNKDNLSHRLYPRDAHGNPINPETRRALGAQRNAKDLLKAVIGAIATFTNLIDIRNGIFDDDPNNELSKFLSKQENLTQYMVDAKNIFF